MKVWLSPALGSDYPTAEARIYGPQTKAGQLGSCLDVAEMCAIALRYPAAERRTIEFGRPALAPLEVVWGGTAGSQSEERENAFTQNA
jgi:hypothetical protein